MYNYRNGKSNIINILKTKTDVIQSSGIPKDDSSFTYKNAYLTWVGAIFIDIKDSSLFFNTKDEKLARLMRAFTSEIITIFQGIEIHRQIGIRGDCVYAIYDTKHKKDLVRVFNVACELNSFMKMFNKIIVTQGYKKIIAGIGLGCDEELIIKAGKTGTGINDKIWIGKAVVDASNLSGIANRSDIKPIAMSQNFHKKIIDIIKKENKKYEKLIIYSANNRCYHCDISEPSFDEWIENGMKG